MNMRPRMAAGLLAALVASCTSHTAPRTSLADGSSNPYFERSVRIACNARVQDASYCSCFTAEIDKVTPAAVKADLMSGSVTAEQQLTDIMIDHMNEVQRACSEFLADNLSIPEFTPSASMLESLAGHKGKLLTPEKLQDVDKLAKLTGWRFAMVDPSVQEFVGAGFIYTGETDGGYYFDYVDFSVSPPDVLAKFLWKEGLKYYLKTDEVPPRYARSLPGTCDLTVGLCEYTDSSGIKQKVYTEFRDGMWITNRPTFGMARALEVNIYDSSGLPLNYYFKNLKTGSGYEQRRLEALPDTTTLEQ